MQAAQGRAEDSRAAAAEAEEQLCEQQQRAEEAARQLAEAKQELTMREDTLQELTLENQRLQVNSLSTKCWCHAVTSCKLQSRRGDCYTLGSTSLNGSAQKVVVCAMQCQRRTFPRDGACKSKKGYAIAAMVYRVQSSGPPRFCALKRP